MNSTISIIYRKISFIYFLFYCGWLVSCGLRTAPHYLPEAKSKPKSTFTDLKVQQRDERLRLSWQINQTERTNIIKKLNLDPDFEDYFLIQENQIQLGCRDCETQVTPPLRVLFSSNSFIREGNLLYYYIDLPMNDLNLHEYEVIHLGPDDEILSPAQTVKFRQSNLFPKVPLPSLQLVQIENENQIMRFVFGKVVMKTTTVIDDDSEKLLEQKTEKSENSEIEFVNKQQQIKSRIFVLRLSWPALFDKGLKRLQGKGNYFEELDFYHVHLYRLRSGEEWAETPIYRDSNQNNHFLDRLKIDIPVANYPHLADTHPTISPAKISFYIDLRGQNGDTWSYKLRLVDRFGNESAASETVSFQSPETTVIRQSYAKKTFVPISD